MVVPTCTKATVVQLRLDEWLTDKGKQPLPVQPVMKIEVTAEEIEQAISNRKAIAVGSASGPSYLPVGETPTLTVESPHAARSALAPHRLAGAKPVAS